MVDDDDATKVQMMHLGWLETNKGLIAGLGKLATVIPALGAPENMEQHLRRDLLSDSSK